MNRSMNGKGDDPWIEKPGDAFGLPQQEDASSVREVRRRPFEVSPGNQISPQTRRASEPVPISTPGSTLRLTPFALSTGRVAVSAQRCRNTPLLISDATLRSSSKRPRSMDKLPLDVIVKSGARHEVRPRVGGAGSKLYGDARLKRKPSTWRSLSPVHMDAALSQPVRRAKGTRSKLKTPKEGDRTAPICIADDSEDEDEDDAGDMGMGKATDDEAFISESTAGETLMSQWAAATDSRGPAVFGSAGCIVSFWELYIFGGNDKSGVQAYVTNIKATAPVSTLTIQFPVESIKFLYYDTSGNRKFAAFCNPSEKALPFRDIRTIWYGDLGTWEGSELMFIRFENLTPLSFLVVVLSRTEFSRMRSCLDASSLSDKLQPTSRAFLSDLRAWRGESGATKLNPCSPLLQQSPPTLTADLLERVTTRSKVEAVASSNCTHDLTNEGKSAGDDTAILFVFPLQKRAQDSITITVGDQKRLKLGEWLNDNLIDLRIKLLVFHVDIKKYASFYCAIDSDSPAPLNHPELSGEGSMCAMSCHLYTSLTEKGAGRERVRAMTKSVNIFDKEFIFIPINKSGHWSLACVIRPGILAEQQLLQVTLEERLELDRTNILLLQNEEPDECGITESANRNRACILHLDSLNIHKDYLLGPIYAFLNEEYALRYDARDGKASQVFSKRTCPTVRPKQADQQKNGADCGVYVIEFVRHLADSSMCSTEEDINNAFASYFNTFTFSESHANAARHQYSVDIDLLSTAYEKYRRWDEDRRQQRKRMKQTCKRECGSADFINPCGAQSASAGCGSVMLVDVENNCTTESLTSSDEDTTTMVQPSLSDRGCVSGTNSTAGVKSVSQPEGSRSMFVLSTTVGPPLESDKCDDVERDTPDSRALRRNVTSRRTEI